MWIHQRVILERSLTMAQKRNLRFDEDFIEDFYNKKEQLHKLEEELKEMTIYIKTQLEGEHMFYTRVGTYTAFLEPCHTPNEVFIQLMKQQGYAHLIKESCLMKDFNLICEQLHLDKDLYCSLKHKRLYVKKFKK